MSNASTRPDSGPLESIADGYYEVDLDGRFTAVNATLCELLGHPRHEILGHSYAHFTRGSGSSAFDDALSGQRFEWRFERSDGSRVYVEGSVAPIHDGEGRTIGYRGIIRDITDRKRDERRLTEQAERLSLSRDEAIVRTRSKSDFVVSLSHEIRRPMNEIIGMTELALETELDREQRDFLLAVRSSASALLTLLNDILDLSKIEAGKLQLDRIPFDLRDCIADMLEPLAARARERDVELLREIAPAVPGALVGDPTRLRQILSNIVEDAIETANGGRIVLRAEGDGGDERMAELRFEISTTNAEGEARDTANAADDETAPDGTRSGLGLAISQELVRLMRGRIWVENGGPGRRTVSFTVPFPVSSERVRRMLVRHDDLRGLHVLIADGNRASRQMLVDGLRYFGLRAEAHGSGQALWQALEAASGSDDAGPVVVLDAQLPDGNGFDLARRIRGDESLPATRVIVLTRSGQRGDAAYCRDLGVSGYLAKPIGPLDLLDSIRAVLGEPCPERGATLVTRHSLRESRPRLDVLVAEDDPVHQLVIRTLLERSGHRVTLATTGEQLRDALAESHRDVILLDVPFSDVDKTNALQALHGLAGGSLDGVPIVAMVAQPSADERRRLVEAGAAECLRKPFEPGELFGVLERCVPFGRSHQGPVDAAAPRTAERAEPIVDRQRLFEQTGGDPDLLRQIVEVFFEEKSAMLDGVRRAVEAGDGRAIERAAHRLRSTCGTLAARLAAEAAAQLERMGQAGDLEQVRQLYELLEQRMRQLETELRRLIRPWQGGQTAGA